ncbi:hypothetical protein GCM10010985_04560 [Caballeronia grimmiae]|uniref:Uncharacterized protein n=1 Tax=Caballeronia grimmiae TaxID=1071679 RepID=A0ABQ1R0P6_9BURK|nr:hypothetical protein GCM10010985_04560 [Caballeronia grimmiae]
MPVRNAFRLVLIPIAMIMTAPAFAKYTEEWVGGKDDAEAHAKTRQRTCGPASYERCPTAARQAEGVQLTVRIRSDCSLRGRPHRSVRAVAKQVDGALIRLRPQTANFPR